MNKFPREYFINGIHVEDRGKGNSILVDIGVERFHSDKELSAHSNVLRFRIPPTHVNSKITIYGSDNIVRLGNFSKMTNSKITISGSQNTVSIGARNNICDTSIGVKGEQSTLTTAERSKMKRMQFFVNGGNNSITIGESVRISGFMELTGPNNTFYVGNNVSIVQAKFFISEKRKISIGDDCMISWEVIFRTSDMHGILDAKTRRRLNNAGDITLERHVWVAAQAMLLKGSYISKNSIVGARATTTKKFTKPGVILGGTPAQVIKEGITWSKKLEPYEGGVEVSEKPSKESSKCSNFFKRVFNFWD